MSITCDVILQWGATPEQLRALGAALWRWCDRTAGDTGIYQYLDNQALADLIAECQRLTPQAEHPSWAEQSADLKRGRKGYPDHVTKKLERLAKQGPAANKHRKELVARHEDLRAAVVAAMGCKHFDQWSGYVPGELGAYMGNTVQARNDDERRVQYFMFIQVLDVETGEILFQHKTAVTKAVI